MREVVIQSWCDECIANDDHVSGEAIDITWRNRDVSLDLCDKHSEPFHEVDRLVAAYGHSKKAVKKKQVTERVEHTPEGKVPRPSDVYRRADGTYKCPDCDRVLDSPQGLGSHRYKSHDYRAS